MTDMRLDDQLAELARQDRDVPTPAHVEVRTMTAWDDWARGQTAASPRRLGRRWVGPALVALAASGLIALVLPRPLTPRPRPSPQVAPQPALEIPPPPPALVPSLEAEPASGMPAAAGRQRRAIARRAEAAVETAGFVPLGPDIEFGLSGSFQLERVRVPRDVLADLGLIVDAHRGGEPVQADVVFGEDGMAKAIRLAPVSRRMP